METEEWKSMDVLGFSKYSCSESGKVFNISTNKLLNGSTENNYVFYQPTDNLGRRQKVKSHILISELFSVYVFDPTDNESLNRNNYEWVPIPGFEKYKICKEGKIISTRGEIMNPYIQSEIFCISLRISKNIIKKCRVYMLVAITFIDNPNNFIYIKFKDGNSLNIHKDNLEWSNNKSKDEDDPNEIWEPMRGFCRYQINPKGIRNAITHKILTPQFKKGYPYVSLSNNDNYEDLSATYLHRAMAKQYIHNPDPEILIEVNHKNGMRDDFRVENLEWVTHTQNVKHAFETGLWKKGASSSRGIELLDEHNNVICTFDSYDKTSEYVGCNGSKICRDMKPYKLQNGIAIVNGYRLKYKICIDLEGEIWINPKTPYDNINNKYKVSNYGRIKNKWNKLLTPKIDPDNYVRIKLSNYIKGQNLEKMDCMKSFYVHVIVAYAFLEFEGNRNEYQVNHKDKNPKNNNLINLEILTIKDHYTKDHGKPTLCVTKNNEYYIFESQTIGAATFKTKPSNVNTAISRKTESAKHKWYDLNSKEAQDILEIFRLEGINPSIPSKIIEIEQIKTEISSSTPKRKLKLIIIS